MLDDGEFPPGHITRQIGKIESILGLTPESRQRLRWKIVDDDPVDAEGTEGFEW